MLILEVDAELSFESNSDLSKMSHQAQYRDLDRNPQILSVVVKYSVGTRHCTNACALKVVQVETELRYASNDDSIK